jgi:hypothetical protein
VLELTEADLRPFRVGRADNATVIDLPLPQQPSVPGGPPRDPAPREDQQKPAQPAPVEVGPPGLPAPRTRPSTAPPITPPATTTTPPTTPPPVRPPDLD